MEMISRNNVGYVRVMEYKIFIYNKTIPVTVFRSSFEKRVAHKNPGLTVFTDMISYDAKVIPIELITMFTNKEYYRYQDLAEMYFFDKVQFSMSFRFGKFYGKTAILNDHDYETHPISAREYAHMSLSRVGADVVAWQFEPIRNEAGLYQELLAEGTKIVFPKTMEEPSEEIYDISDKVADQISELELSMGNYKEFLEMVPMPDRSERESYMTSLMTRTMQMTPSVVDRYQRFRHTNMVEFLVELFYSNGIDVVGYDGTSFVEDINLKETFNYTGYDSILTPDMAIKFPSGDVIIMDVAFTEGNIQERASKKAQKYKFAMEGLNNLDSRNFYFVAFVVKIKDDMSFDYSGLEVDEETHKKIYEYIEDVFNNHTEIMLSPGYTAAKRQVDNNYIDSLESEIMRTEKILVSQYLKRTKVITKTLPMMDERKMPDRSSWSDLPMINTEDDPEVERMRAKYDEVDPDIVLSFTSKIITKSIKEGNYPSELKSVTNYSRTALVNRVNEKLEEEKLLAKEIRATKKVQKSFMYPMWEKKGSLLDNDEDRMFRAGDFSSRIMESYDGTEFVEKGALTFFKGEYEPGMKKKEAEREENDYNPAGYHVDFDEDIMTMENFMYSMLKEEESDKLMQTDKTIDSKLTRDYMKTKISNIIDKISFLTREISYLSERRYIKIKGLDMRGNWIAIKNYDGIRIAVQNGPKMTREKQIRFKVIIDTDKYSSMDGMFHHMYKIPDTRALSSKWLTISMADIKHFVTIKERAMSMMSMFNDLQLEVKENDEEEEPEPSLGLKECFPLVVLMAHKRGVSTTLQLNRYIVHSMTALSSDRVGLVDKVDDGPVRSILEAYCRATQYRYFLRMADKVVPILLDALKKMRSSDPFADKLMLPSFIEPDIDIEFSSMMNEMYYGNIFNRDAGFNMHRSTAVIKKMAAEERKYMQRDLTNVIGDGGFEGLDKMEAFIKQKDTMMAYSEDYVVAAIKQASYKVGHKSTTIKSILRALNETVDDIMTTKSSLKSGSVGSRTLEYTIKTIKDMAFNTLYEKVAKLDTRSLWSIMSKEEFVEAIFSLFPKGQIGGPREILIQAVTTRLHARLVETFFREMVKSHEKDFVAEGKDKVSTQLNTLMRNKLAIEKHTKILNKNKDEDSIAVTLSFNSDKSKWAPSFMMRQFIYMVIGMELPKEIEYEMINTFKSFSFKQFVVTDKVKEMFSKKDSESIELDEDQEFFGNDLKNRDGFPVIRTGMGQGMFQYASSWYHCIMDDFSDKVMMTVISNTKIVSRFEMGTMITSDDSTKMMRFIAPNIKQFLNFSSIFVVLQDAMSRLANMHTNWKKSAIQMIITEFNSLFSIGKRTLQAVIKDVYNACDVVDLTEPEMAVREVVSNIARTMKSGAYMTTCTNISLEMREFLKFCYKISDDKEMDLCRKLDCSRDILPFHLGFVPTTFLVETFIYGLDVQCYNPYNNENLTKFYRNLHSALTDEVNKKIDEPTFFNDDITGKYRIVLGTRVNNRLKKDKMSFYGSMAQMDAAKMEMDKYAMSSRASDFLEIQARAEMETWTANIKKKFEYSQSKSVHSMVRALQLPAGKLMIHPMDKEAINMKEKFKDFVENPNYDDGRDLSYFVDFIMSKVVSDTAITSMVFTTGMAKIMSRAMERHDKIHSLPTRLKSRHSKVRKLRVSLSRSYEMIPTDKIIEYLFGDRVDLGNAGAEIIQSIGKIMGTDLLKSEDPAKEIKLAFPESNMPFTSFKSFLDYHRRISHANEIEMVTDTPCRGGAHYNIMAIMEMRSMPDYIYVSDYDYAEGEKIGMRMSSLISMRQDSLLKNLSEKIFRNIDDATEIEPNDTKPMKCLKILRVESSMNKDINDMMSTYVFWDKDTQFVGTSSKPKAIKRYFWTDINTTIIMSMDMNKRDMKLHMFVKDRTMLTYSNIITLFMADFKKFKLAGWTHEWMTTQRNVEYSNAVLRYSTDDIVEFKTKIKYSDLDWKFFMDGVVNFEGETIILSWEIYRKEYMILRTELKSVMETINPWKDYWESYSTNTMTMKELQTMFLDMGWIDKERIFTRTRELGLMKKYNVKSVMEAIDQTIESAEDEEVSMIDELIMGGGGNATEMKFRVIDNIENDLEEPEVNFEFDTADLSQLGVSGPIVSRYTDVNMSNADDQHMNLRKVMDMMVKRVSNNFFRINKRPIEELTRMQDSKLASVLFNHIRYSTYDIMPEDKMVELIMFSVLSVVRAEYKIDLAFRVRLIPYNEVLRRITAGDKLLYQKVNKEARTLIDTSGY
jgi:hypothetical protein